MMEVILGFTFDSEIAARPPTASVPTDLVASLRGTNGVLIQRGESERFLSHIRIGLAVASFSAFANGDRSQLVFSVLRSCETVNEARELRDQLNALSVANW